jgi:glycosyltransferase involved in cell wall biosynthesis
MITLICSNYNSDKWIDGYLESLNSQILNKFSIIFVDANSSDGSLEKIKKFNFRQGIQVKIIEYKTKIGLYDAWNAAIDLSETDYVMNYNTDDRLFPAALLALTSYAIKYPEVDIFYQNAFVTYSEKHDSLDSYFIFEKNHTHEKLLNGCYCGPFPLLKKKALESVGKFNQKYTMSGDYDMWLRLSKARKKFYRIDEYLGSYYRNPTGLSTNPETRNKQWLEDCEIRELNK